MKKKSIINISLPWGEWSFIIFFLVSILMTFSTHAFSQKLTFTFDASGNQTKRLWICINCPSLSVLNSDSVASGDRLKPDIIEIGNGYSLYLNRKEKVIKIHSADLNKNAFPIFSLVNFGNKNKVAIESFKKEDYVEFSTDQLMAGTYLLRISVGDDKWVELIIEKVKEA